jgi:hypothetical protein
MPKRRIYEPRVVADHIMVQDDFDRLHNYLLERRASRKSPTTSAMLSRRNGRSWRASYCPKIHHEIIPAGTRPSPAERPPSGSGWVHEIT